MDSSHAVGITLNVTKMSFFEKINANKTKAIKDGNLIWKL